ncbi:hypothetical protein [Acinetobacter indicus]|uniref:hypothetical protein n=1 Tax=Acinetobacter indicus TaxID=756892 RepID=UPI00144488ED|nr:hypothetical protein [Acinetobacter indicus]
MNKISTLAETTENYFDNTVLETTDTIFQEILKAFPLASSGIAIYRLFRSYNEKQKLKNILEFIKEGENLEPGSLLRIFKDQNNLEIGCELLNALDKTYLVHQSKMLARLALLYDVKEINRENFLRYAHIIPQLTSFLLEGLDKAYTLSEKNKTNKNYHLKNEECNFSLSELERFGFLYVVATYGSGNHYGRSKDLVFFYENIYQNKYRKN